MKAVLMAFSPEKCEKIFRDKKTVDVRKVAPKLKTPYKVYAYCTKQKIRGELILCRSKELSKLFGYGSIVGINKGFRQDEDELLHGKVIGEFLCDEKHDIRFTGASYMINNDISLTNSIARQSCLQFDDMFSYLSVKGGAALHITKPKRYDKPKELSEFSRYGYKKIEHKGSGYVFCANTQCRYCEPDEVIAGLYKPPVCRKGGCKITRPPRSWMYVEEIEE